MPVPLSLPRFHLLQVVGEEGGDVFEAGDVVGVDVHQSFVCFEAGAGDFFAAGVVSLHVFGRSAVRSADRTLSDFEQMQHAKIFEQFRDAAVGIEKLNGAIDFIGLRRVQFQAKPREHAEKGAVHEDAFGEVENETGVTALQQLIKEGFEINAGREVRAAGDLHHGGFFTDRHQHFC
jgi:hypothetical protein